MTLTSTALLSRFKRGGPTGTGIDLTLRPAYRDLLHKLGHPQNRLPPVFHVAGTNGKGSTCAFLRSILEADGYHVHVYTSPHLVTFHERIRIAGKLIEEDELADILTECDRLTAQDTITYFEAATAAAFAAFARHPADFTILETGLGGRLDATNVIDTPRATIITRLSYDHREYLGGTLAEIAREKAGIMRMGVPCFVAHQPDAEARDALLLAARTLKTPVGLGGEDWAVAPMAKGFRYVDRYKGGRRELDLPLPALLGEHQLLNAGLAINALAGLVDDEATIAKGLRNVDWPARLQNLQNGALAKLLPQGWELWLDGGHNNSAGEVLAAQMKNWQAQDTTPRPLHLIAGMIKTKNPVEFLAPLAPHAANLRAVNIPNEPQSLSADELAASARVAGIANAAAAKNIRVALEEISALKPPGRILICGSLYLAGEVLKENAQ